jgi:hypothetical protein
LIFDLQRGFLPAKNFVGGGKLAPPKICMAGGKTSLAKKLYNKSYFEAGRSPRKRSILNVCEHSEDKPDAKRALLDGFRKICMAEEISRLAKCEKPQHT